MGQLTATQESPAPLHTTVLPAVLVVYAEYTVPGPPHACSHLANLSGGSSVPPGRHPGVGDEALQTQQTLSGQVSRGGQVVAAGQVAHVGQRFFFLFFLLKTVALSRLTAASDPIRAATSARRREPTAGLEWAGALKRALSMCRSSASDLKPSHPAPHRCWKQ